MTRQRLRDNDSNLSCVLMITTRYSGSVYCVQGERGREGEGEGRVRGRERERERGRGRGGEGEGERERVREGDGERDTCGHFKATIYCTVNIIH